MFKKTQKGKKTMNRLQFSLWLTDKSVNEFRNGVEWFDSEKYNTQSHTHTHNEKEWIRGAKKNERIILSYKETLTHLFHCEIVGQFGFSFVLFLLLVYHFHIATLQNIQKIKQHRLKFIDNGDGSGRSHISTSSSSMSIIWINLRESKRCYCILFLT